LVIIGVHDEDFQNFCSLCKTNGVCFCIDDRVKKQKGDILNIVVRKADIPMVDAICKRISAESEEFHISIPAVAGGSLPCVDVDKVQKNIRQSGYSLEEKLREDVSDELGDGDWVVLSNTLSDTR
jgi:hypothetical protein